MNLQNFNNDSNKHYTYVFVRKDIPVEQQIVQTAHAALEAGLVFPNPSDEPNSLIVIGVSNQEQLLKAIEYTQKQDIKLVTFFEPDWDYGLTAFASQPIPVSNRKIFKKFQLWRNSK